MLIFLFITGLILFITGLVMLVINFFKRKSKRNMFILMAVGFIIFIVGATDESTFKNDESQKNFQSSKSITKIETDKIMKESVDSSSEVIISTASSELVVSNESISNNKESLSSSTSETNVNLKKKDSIKNKIDLSDNGPYQFSGAALITPEIASIKNNKLELSFEWRNDNGYEDKHSFLGSGITISVNQGDKELIPENDSINTDGKDTSGESIYIKKNSSLEISYIYSLVDDSPITVTMLPLEGNNQSFIFNIK